MLKTCKYCGRIHDIRHICQQKATRISANNYRHGTAADKFRRSLAWTEMSRRIRARDFFMCLCCADGIPKDDGTFNTIETDNISVHHIIPIEENYELRLDETNLISVCSSHHEACESQQISRDRQHELVNRSIERREKNAGHVVC